MTTAQQVLDQARATLGVGPDPNDITEQYGPKGWGISRLHGGYDWCAVSTYVWARRAGGASLVSPGPFVSDHKAFHQARGTWLGRTSSPRPGDEVIFDWPGTPGDQNHIGIVEAVANGRITTIEGNSGDRVTRRSYPINDSRIHGFGRPKYSATGTAGGITEGLLDMLSDAEQTELLNRTREIHDVLFNPNYGMKGRQLAQHYWMLGQPLPEELRAQFKVTPDSPFRELVSAGPGAPVDVDEAALAAELAPALLPSFTTAVTQAVTDALAGHDSITPEEAQAAAEAALRTVLGGLDNEGASS